MFKIPEEPLSIIKHLHDAGHDAWIVGGAIRDLYLGRPVVDWDITTSADRETIKVVFRGWKTFCLKHETVTLVQEANHYEITPFRGVKEIFISIEQDLKARDFTINAMAYDPGRGVILDPFGGREDLFRKLIRAVHDPKERFQEDPLRMLRAVRLAAELEFSIDPFTRGVMTDMAGQLQGVARERIRGELLKILMVSKPSKAFNQMRQANLLPFMIPELLEGYHMRQTSPYHRYTIYKHILETVDRVDPNPILRLSALFHDIGKPRVRQKINGHYRFLNHEATSADLAREIMKRLGFSNADMEKVTLLIRNHMIDYQPYWKDSAIRKLLKQVGPENIEELLILRKADLKAHNKRKAKLRHLSDLKKRIKRMAQKPLGIKKHELCLDGREIMRILNIPPGPRIGALLDLLTAEVIENPDLNTKERLTHILEKIKIFQ